MNYFFKNNYEKFLNHIKTKFFATETRKSLGENFKLLIENPMIILYSVQNLNKARPNLNFEVGLINSNGGRFQR